MTSQVTLRVRPGFTYGAHKQFKGGDIFSVDAEQAVQLLGAFGDKLEQVAEPHEPAVTTAAVDVETLSPATAAERPEKPVRRKQREAGDS